MVLAEGFVNCTTASDQIGVIYRHCLHGLFEMRVSGCNHHCDLLAITLKLLLIHYLSPFSQHIVTLQCETVLIEFVVLILYSHDLLQSTKVLLDNKQ